MAAAAQKKRRAKNENPPVFGFSFSHTPHHVPKYT
jgi:hypothetical protein